VDPPTGAAGDVASFRIGDHRLDETDTTSRTDDPGAGVQQAQGDRTEQVDTHPGETSVRGCDRLEQVGDQGRRGSAVLETVTPGTLGLRGGGEVAVPGAVVVGGYVARKEIPLSDFCHRVELYRWFTCPEPWGHDGES